MKGWNLVQGAVTYVPLPGKIKWHLFPGNGTWYHPIPEAFFTCCILSSPCRKTDGVGFTVRACRISKRIDFPFFFYEMSNFEHRMSKNVDRRTSNRLDLSLLSDIGQKKKSDFERLKFLCFDRKVKMSNIKYEPNEVCWMSNRPDVSFFIGCRTSKIRYWMSNRLNSLAFIEHQIWNIKHRISKVEPP